MKYRAVRKNLDHYAIGEEKSSSIFSDNLGLMVDKYALYAADKKDQTEVKDSFIRFIVDSWSISQSLRDIYSRCFGRWKSVYESDETCRLFPITTSSRLIIGSGNMTAFEFGMMLNKPWGLPYIPGSTLKGCVRSFLCENGYSNEVITELLGSNDISGSVAFFDTWLDPQSSKVFERDITTVHYQKYYSPKKDEDPDLRGMLDPVPVSFVAIKPNTTFYVLLQGENTVQLDFIKEQLLAALKCNGIGSKKTLGYGRFAERVASFKENKMSVPDLDTTKVYTAVLVEKPEKKKSWKVKLEEYPEVTGSIAASAIPESLAAGAKISVKVSRSANGRDFTFTPVKGKGK